MSSQGDPSNASPLPDDNQRIGIDSPERSIADAFRLRGEFGCELARDALREWLRRGGKPARLIASNPDTRAADRPAVFCFDKETQCQALDRSQPSLTRTLGRPVDASAVLSHDRRRPWVVPPRRLGPCAKQPLSTFSTHRSDLMTIAQVLKIIRNHTGPNSNDKVKITHDEVLAMTRAAKDDDVITMGARNALLGAVFTFGGTEIHPDIFSSPADKALMVSTAMEGIETAAKFGKVGARSQLNFIKWTLALDIGAAAGFVTQSIHVSDLPSPVQTKVNGILACESNRAGKRFDPHPSWVLISSYVRGGDAYGYECNAAWPTVSGNGGLWSLSFYGDQNGDTLLVQSSYEPPDDD
jgi:hypothetical protein